MEPYVELIRPDGRRDRHMLTAARVTLGRSGEANVSVPDADELEPLHLLLAPRADGCWVSAARDARTPALVSGVALDHGLVDWGTEIDVGALTIRLSHSDADRDRRQGLLKTILLCGLAVAAGSVVLDLVLSRSGGLPRPDGTPPALFADQTDGCPEAGEAAAHLAREALDEGYARAQRYPFDPREGVRAVDRFAVARDCYAQVGDQETAPAMDREYRRMRARVEEDYRLHCLRIERAIQGDRFADALFDARLLLGYLDHASGAYRDWLVLMERLLHIEVEKQRRAARRGPGSAM